MENQPSPDELRRDNRDELRAELARRGLPRAYIARLLSELDDHLIDLLEERNSTMGAARKLQPEQIDQNSEQRLGDPTQLAIFAADQYHSRTFWGRHPLVTFLFAPLPLLVACWIVFPLALWAVLWGVSTVGEYAFGLADDTFKPKDHLLLQAVAAAIFSWYMLVLPPLAAAVLLCRTYRRNALDWRWPLLGCALVAAVAATFQISWRLDTGPGESDRGMLMLGFNVSYAINWLFLSFLPKFALAFGIGLLLIKRARQQLELDNIAPT
jgi:hypothetical protein